MNVKTLCLGALCLGEKSGYDIKKLFEATFRHFQSATFGSIYPALGRLERGGLIQGRVEPGSGHPDRKIYRLTDAGRATLVQELMAESPTEQLRSEFMVLMFFSHLIPTERLAEILEEVRLRYADTLAYLESILDLPEHTPGTRFTVRAGIARYRAMLELLDEEGPGLLREHGSRESHADGPAHA
jgi:PadR family transcriptional regulator AphA